CGNGRIPRSYWRTSHRADADAGIAGLHGTGSALSGSAVFPHEARQLLAVVAAFSGNAALADLASAVTVLGFTVDDPPAHLIGQHFVTSRPDAVECMMPRAVEVAYRRPTLADHASVHGRVADILRGRLPAEHAVIELVAYHAMTARSALRECDPGSGAERGAAVVGETAVLSW